MPRQVKAYACEFKCGRNVTTHKADMERHEEQCWSNPANRTCKTCRHDIGRVDGFDCARGAKKKGESIVNNCKKWKAMTSPKPYIA